MDVLTLWFDSDANGKHIIYSSGIMALMCATTDKALIELVQELPLALHAEVRDSGEFLLEKQHCTQKHSA